MPVRSVMIYSPVPDIALLDQGFYRAEADSLRELPGISEVRTTNRLIDVACGTYDGLVCFFYSYSAAACLIARARGRPAIVTGGGEQVFPELARGWRRLVRRLAFQLTALLATRILATSTSDLAQMRVVAPWAGDKMILSFHGADAVLTPAVGGSTDRPAGSFATICGLDTEANVKRKGIPQALEILAKAAEDCETAHLTIIGRATCRKMVEDIAESLGVADRVVFAGYVTERQKLQALRAHRYYVQLSIYEGFGIGALEALAQGCLVLHSGAGGLADTIADFGVTIPAASARDFSLATLPDCNAINSGELARHLKQFDPEVRARTIEKTLFG